MRAECVLHCFLLISDTIATLISIFPFMDLLTDYCGTRDSFLLSIEFLRIPWSDIKYRHYENDLELLSGTRLACD